MTCKLYQTELSAYLDGELPVARAARLEAHLRVCPHCQGELQELSGISSYIRAASQGLRVSQDFDQRVLHAVTSYQVVNSVQRRQHSLLRPLLIAGLILLALLGAIQHFFLEPAPIPVPQPQPSAAAVAPTSPMPVAPDVDEEESEE